MVKFISKLVLVVSFLTFFETSSFADVQTLSLLGGKGSVGDIDPYTESSRDGGVT